MYCLKRIILAGLFIVPILFAQSAWAGLDFLPDSSHYQGSAYKGPSGDRVRVDFAVYDRDGGNEFATSGDKQFTYVYHVFNEVANDTFSIDIFRVFEIDPAAISGTGIDQISSEDDANGGIATDLEYISPLKTDGVWVFEEGALIQGKHSWFLTISSDHDFIAGDFAINNADSGLPVTPEPTTLILLGVGSFILMARRKGSVGMSR